MNNTFYSINSLRTMELIDINSGCKLGYIKDFKIDIGQCKVLSLILPSQKMSWFGKINDIEVPWNRVRKIGVDVILVDGADILEANIE